MGCGVKAIETRYAGCRFRSRLEARWAVFFDHLGVAWQYEPQGFVVRGQPYLPDFLLPECGTWVEVKGSEAELDRPLMRAAARQLPLKTPKLQRGPTLLILGPVPESPEGGDLGWIGLDWLEVWHGEVRAEGGTFACSVRRGLWECSCGAAYRRDVPEVRKGDLCLHLWQFSRSTEGVAADESLLIDRWWGFGRYEASLAPVVLTNTSQGTPVATDDPGWLTPSWDPHEEITARLPEAYRAARSARFEHGEKGRS